jgi:hypothetical protein
MGAVRLLSERKTPFVLGTGINVYNDRTLRFLAGLGAKRWVMPVELSRDDAGVDPGWPAGGRGNRGVRLWPVAAGVFGSLLYRPPSRFAQG